MPQKAVPSATQASRVWLEMREGSLEELICEKAGEGEKSLLGWETPSQGRASQVHVAHQVLRGGPWAFDKGAKGGWGLELPHQRFSVLALGQFNVSVFPPANWIIHKHLMSNLL